MNIQLIIRICALAAMLAASGCETDEDHRPVTSSTTVTEETTSVHPLPSATTTETTTTRVR